MQQLIQPNLNQTDVPGWCLRLVRNVFGIPPKWDYAWKAWEKSNTRHVDALPNDVIVPVYFTWTGKIGGVTQNWGDVALNVPGRGVFGTPLKGGGNSNRWFANVEERARAIGGGAQYVGWTEDVNGVRVVGPSPAPAPVPPSAPSKQLSGYSNDELFRELFNRFK